MTRLMYIQLLGANVAFAATVVVSGLSAKPGDRTVFVVRSPWRSASDISRDIGRVGGHVVASAAIPYVTKATLPDAGALNRLWQIGTVLVFTSSPTPVCVTASKVKS